MIKRTNGVSELQRTNEETIKKIKDLMAELQMVDEDNLTISSYAFAIHDSEVEVFKHVVSVEKYILNNMHKMKWVPKLEWERE